VIVDVHHKVPPRRVAAHFECESGLADAHRAIKMNVRVGRPVAKLLDERNVSTSLRQAT
jgi:hypothetical protein